MAAPLATSAAARKRFEREARAAAAVSHDHIVTIHAVEEALLPSPHGRGAGGEGLPYLVMQCVAGLSLQQRIDRDGPLALFEILRIGMQTAAGLAAAHAQGLIHRDIKPANILLENGVERVKITDFGLARAAADASVSQSGIVAGTPQYMAPEQAKGEVVDQRADLFSLGSVLYAMCTGRAPFRATSSMAVLKRVCEEAPSPIREANAEIPPWLIEVIEKLHAKSPNDRFQSAAEVAELLGRRLAELQQSAALPVVAPTKVSKTSIHDRGSRDSGSSAMALVRWTAAAAVLLALVVTFAVSEATGVTQVAATIVRLLTPEGTLIVETNDPAVNVTIEGDGGRVITGAGPYEVRLKPGSYQLRADKKGKPVPLEKDLVTITRGGKQVVRVRMESAAPAAAADPSLMPTTEGFTPLFDGKDLTGWAVAGGGTGLWRIEDGAMTCTGPQDHLLTTRNDFGDFHLRAEVKINANGNSGIYFRACKPLVLKGDYEAQISDNPGQGHKTGSLYGLVRVSESPVPPNTWFTYEIIAVGKRIRILVNGKPTADYTEDRAGRNTQGHIALQHHDPETRVFFRKIEVKGLPAGQPARSAGAFVILAAEGNAELAFASLAEAVQAAGDGATIEIRGNGPFTTETIRLSVPLTIRAASGFNPVLRLNANEHTLLEARARLVLEGLEFEGEPDAKTLGRAVDAAGAAMHTANCRFTGIGLYAESLPIFQARNCLITKCRNYPVSLINCPSLESAVLDNSVVLANHFHAAMLVDPTRYGIPAAELELTRNLVVGSGLIYLNVGLRTRPTSGIPLRVHASGNISSTRNAILCAISSPPKGLLEFEEQEYFLRQAIVWREQQNVYPDGMAFLCMLGPSKTTRVRSLAEGHELWRLTETGSLQGPVAHERPLAAIPSADGRIDPADLRLKPNSTGYRAGPDGRDLGPDLEIVGTGEAYERWKQSPEYMRWLIDTGQLN
jgi:hypothetical protein